MSLRLYRALNAHPQRLNKLFFFIFFGHVHTVTPKSCCFTFLQRLLAFVPRSRGVSSALSAMPRKLEQWMLYNGKRCSIIKLDVHDYVKSSICKYSRTY